VNDLTQAQWAACGEAAAMGEPLRELEDAMDGPLRDFEDALRDFEDADLRVLSDALDILSRRYDTAAHATSTGFATPPWPATA
jgi:hypothetical protein